MRQFIFTLDNGTKLSVNPPSNRLYFKDFLTAKDDNQLFESIAKICSNNSENIKIDTDYVLDEFSVLDFNRFVKNFPEWVNQEKNNDPNYPISSAARFVPISFASFTASSLYFSSYCLPVPIFDTLLLLLYFACLVCVKFYCTISVFLICTGLSCIPEIIR